VIDLVLELLLRFGWIWLLAAIVACTFFCILFQANQLDEQAEQGRRNRAESPGSASDVHSSTQRTRTVPPAVFDLDDVEWASSSEPYGAAGYGYGRRTSPPAEYAADRPLVQKLAEVMAEIGQVEARGRNQHFNYSYVTEADLVEAVREKLAERGVVLVPAVEKIETRQGKSNRTITTVFMRFRFIDGETGQALECAWAGTGEDDSDKGIYKAYTGGLKHFLMKAFLIGGGATGTDPDEARGRRGGGEAVHAETGEVLASKSQRRLIHTRFRERHGREDELVLRAILDHVGGTPDTRSLPKAKVNDVVAAVNDPEGTLAAIVDRANEGDADARRIVETYIDRTVAGAGAQ
jgi:hypothetical protein